jgi:3-hydroxybutyryl-CoA dehydratase
MPDKPLYFEDLEVGREWVSEGRVVTQEDVAGFAALTGDFSPIHTDPGFARHTSFRRCIAHGLLGLSVAAGLSHDAPPVRTVAFLALREWHFRAPVYPGDTIRARSRVVAKEVQGRGRRGAVVWRMEVVNQDGRVVQDGVTETLVETAVGAGRATDTAA